MRYAARVARNKARGRLRFRCDNSPQNRGTKASQAKNVRQKGTGPIMEKGSRSSAAEKMPRSQGCRASLAMGESLPPLPYHLLWYQPLAITRDGKRDTIDDYAGCYLFHASLRNHVLR